MLQKTRESFEQQGDQTSQSSRKSTLNIHWKDWCWGWSSNTLATWFKELTHWKRPCWEGLKAGGEGDDRGWHGWMASPTQQTWAWASPRRWWTGKPGMLQSMGSQRVGHHWATEHHHHLHDNPILCPLLWESDIFVVFIFLSCIFKLFSQLFPSACKSD